jgi:DNA-binding response OmpR family regulator
VRADSAIEDRPTILIIDDDPDVLQLLRLMLETEGFDAVLAPDGPTGLRRLAEQPPDVVLLDIMMPGMDGWQVLQALATHPDPPAVVVVSAKTASSDRSRAFELGATGYLCKPFSPEDLVRSIDDALEPGDVTPEPTWRQLLNALGHPRSRTS